MRVMGVLIGTALLVGCGGESAGQFVDQFAANYCTVLSTCYPQDFAEAYPNGQDDCVGSFSRGLTQQKLNAESTCSADQRQQCLNDISALTCGQTLMQTPVPDSCTCP